MTLKRWIFIRVSFILILLYPDVTMQYFADTALVGFHFFTLGSHKNTTEELLGKISIDCKCQRIINNNLLSIDQPFLGINEKVKKRIEANFIININFVD